jgi:hypothetical protein
MQNSSFDKCDDLLGSAEDKAGIILEKVARDGPDTIFLLGEGREYICEIGDIVRGAREAVEFLL